jgi:hypothetical protein
VTDLRIDRLQDMSKHRPAPGGLSPIAILPDEKNKSRDHADHDKHPVLTFETQKRKMLDEKLHRLSPSFYAR